MGEGRKEVRSMDSVRKAKILLAEVTPLKQDCGRVCGARCCESLEGEETGMLLFPEEEDDYENLEGWRIIPAGREMLVICPGRCSREDRPLACRMFPLLPIVTETGITVRTDERARGICPLTRQGKKGMDPAFVAAVQRAGELLATEEATKAFLERLTEEQEDLHRLRKQLGGIRG